MKGKIIFLTNFVASLFTAALLFTPVNAEAWGSSGNSWESEGTSWGSGGSITEDDCRFCHEDLDRFPRLINTNPDKHHLFVGKEIPQTTIAPYATSSNNYECLSCHIIEQTDVTDFQISVERDCLQCHPIKTVSGSPRSDNVHHDLLYYRCNDCHNSMR